MILGAPPAEKEHTEAPEHTEDGRDEGRQVEGTDNNAQEGPKERSEIIVSPRLFVVSQ